MSSTAKVNERLAALTAAGTSPWLDQMRRTLATSGELQRMVEEDSLRGLTSNPSIFEKAILGSDDYDEQLAELAISGLKAMEVYEHLAIHDLQLACDVLRPVWEATDHADGFCSLEVAPSLAHDTEQTKEQARSLWERVGRPNLMVKIPGTPEGVPAIEEMIYEGRNINVTLLFSVEAYETVAEAYIRGLERRHAEGLSLDVHSVASFFVSRVDTEVDKRLDAIGNTELQGTAAVANARAAYQSFERMFRGERFATLAAAGASVQRPLWASTGTKNPDYPDTKYVDELVGPDTVNTMPMATIQAASERATIDPAHPTATIDPTEQLQALADAGIDMKDVTDVLLREGVDAFIKSFDELIAGVDVRREAVVTSKPERVALNIPAALEGAIGARVERAHGEEVARRIWRRDGTLWAPEGTPEVTDRLGWLTIADREGAKLDVLKEFVAGVQADGFTDVVLLGMGGSSLAPEVFRLTWGPQEGYPTLHVLDSTDADAVAAVDELVPLDTTLFLVSSKSGGTIETISLMEHYWAAKPEGSHFVAITDPGSHIEEIATERGFRHVFHGDPEIGGRYSALSAFGLVPAALMGADVDGILHGAMVAEQGTQSYDSIQSNGGLWLGATLGELARHKRDKLTILVAEPFPSLGLWLEQLVAESLGKQGRGILPIAGEPLLPADLYGTDRVFLYLRQGESPDETLEAHTEALRDAGQPVIQVNVEGRSDVGRAMFFAEFAVATAGWALEVNPFDQPNVQEAKDKTGQVLEEYKANGALPEIAEADDAALRTLLEATPPSYTAILAYTKPDPAVDAAIAELRETILRRTGTATTFGYGPRFQHSTGQEHKGGAPNGRFLQLLSEQRSDLEVPGAGYTFAVLRDAEATGDLQTLRDHDLPAERVLLSGDPATAIRELTARIDALLGGGE
jgi:transaldolase/glucose-6-phosphate isomerase